MKKTLIVIGVVFVFMGLLIKAGLRFNTTASVPLGFYWLTVTSPRKGDLVLFCPPNSAIFREAQQRGYLGVGNCPNGTGYLIKKVMAVQGDIIAINDQGVMVNSRLVSNSRPLTKDKQGRPLMPYMLHNYQLQENELLLLSDYNPYSFDGRYFGIVLKDNGCGVLKRLWVW